MRDGFDIGALTLCLWRGNSRLFDRSESLLQLRRGLEPCNEGVTPMAERDSPVCDRTGWVGDENGIECLDGVLKLKGMHQSYGAIELRLNFGIAGSGERYGAQSLSAVMVRLSVAQGWSQKQNRCKHLKQGEGDSHHDFLFAMYFSRQWMTA